MKITTNQEAKAAKDKVLQMQGESAKDEGRILRAQAQELRVIYEAAKTSLAGLVGPLTEVKALMGRNFIGPEHYQEVFGQTVAQARLPKGILEVLQTRCPIYNDGKKVFETHKLTLVPMKIGEDAWTLAKLFELVRQQGKDILYEDWIVKGKFTELSLANLKLFDPTKERAGRYILWCDKIPENTKEDAGGWEGTLKAFKTQYPTHRPSYGLELATGLIMHERVNEERLMSQEYGWCLDYLPVGYDGRASAAALSVASFLLRWPVRG